MPRRIPPLNPLRVFEVVARTQNLTAAGQELHVTQSAVSRQIAVLETYLGIELFRRERYGVTLTRAGKAYAQQVIPAFQAIADATEKLAKGVAHGAVRVRTYTTFAAKWLIPRLPEFRELHPGIDVRLSTAVPLVDFDRDPVDLAIQFGDGQWARMDSDLLFHDQVEPVCSPQYLAQYAPDPRYPQSLLRHQLLVSHYRKVEWTDWLEASGLAHEAREAQEMTFGSTLLTWQAAIDGLGVAIGQNHLLTQELASGVLVRPFNRPLVRHQAYYLVRPKLQRESRKVAVFREWLLGVAAGIESRST